MNNTTRTTAIGIICFCMGFLICIFWNPRKDLMNYWRVKAEHHEAEAATLRRLVEVMKKEKAEINAVLNRSDSASEE